MEQEIVRQSCRNGKFAFLKFQMERLASMRRSDRNKGHEDGIPEDEANLIWEYHGALRTAMEEASRALLRLHPAVLERVETQGRATEL